MIKRVNFPLYLLGDIYYTYIVIVYMYKRIYALEIYSFNLNDTYVNNI